MQWLLPDQQRIALKLRISSWLSPLLEEPPLSTQQTLTVDAQNPEQYVLDAEVLDGMQLRRWLLSQGSGLQVLEPEYLRQWMRTIVQEQAESYLAGESGLRKKRPSA